MAVKFEAGKVYQMRFVTDAELKPEFLCVKVTKTMAVFANRLESFKAKIRLHNDIEYVYSGNYSMSPTIYANREVKIFS